MVPAKAGKPLGPKGNGPVDLVGAPVWPNGVTVAAEAAFIVAAAAAAAVVAKNVRLFIVTSLEVLRNLVNADHDSELPIGFVTRDRRSDVRNRATNRTRQSQRRCHQKCVSRMKYID